MWEISDARNTLLRANRMLKKKTAVFSQGNDAVLVRKQSGTTRRASNSALTL